MTSATPSGPIVFAYDGTDLAKLAIEEAGRLFGEAGGEAVVLTVWQPFDVGFVPSSELQFNTAQIGEVREAADATAAAGAAAARAAGFKATSATTNTAPIWKGVAEFAHEHDAKLIVLGSHGHRGAIGHLFGSVAAAVAAHSRRSVLIVHRPS